MCPNADSATAKCEGESTSRTKHEPKHQYESGATRSDRTRKGRFDLIPPCALRRLAIRYEEGAAIHGDRNWQKGFPVSRCIDSAYRHLTQYLSGDRTEDHLAAVMWQCSGAIFFEQEIEAGRLPAELMDIPGRTA